jgi:hypothetical protein
MYSHLRVKLAVNTVAVFLKGRSVESEKEPLLAYGSETTFLSRQRPLLGSSFFISNNKRPLLGNGSVKTYLWQRTRMQHSKSVFYVVRAEMSSEGQC